MESIITKLKDCTCSDSLQVQTLNALPSDSTITFQRFPNGIKISYRNAASEVYSEFIYAKSYEVRASVYFVK